MLSLDRLSLYDCAPTGVGTGDSDDSDDFEPPVGANDDDDPPLDGNQADSDGSEAEEAPPPSSSGDSKKKRNEGYSNSQLCKVCTLRFPDESQRDQRNRRVESSSSKMPILGEGAKLWYMNCCTEHRQWLSNNTILCKGWESPVATPFPRANFRFDARHPEKRCKKYTNSFAPYCPECAKRIQAEEKAQKAAERLAKRDSNAIARAAMRQAQKRAAQERAQRKQRNQDEKESNSRVRREDRQAQAQMRSHMGQYSELVPSKPADKDKTQEEKDRKQAILDEWEKDVAARFGTLEQQRTLDGNSQPEVDNAERPVPESNDNERSAASKEATKRYTRDRAAAALAAQEEDEGCCASKK